jgi:predicted Co/Zn/Cd cation transporter (cation efflux family)
MEEKYNISFLKIINNNDISSLKHNMDNLQEKIAKEINNLNYELFFTIVIKE